MITNQILDTILWYIKLSVSFPDDVYYDINDEIQVMVGNELTDDAECEFATAMVKWLLKGFGLQIWSERQNNFIYHTPLVENLRPMIVELL